ncbi:MAG: hypothetical protein KA472_11305 [Pseudomonadales bacterium]|nr:hypothetical protein [Pseudomonadales bacterium]
MSEFAKSLHAAGEAMRAAERQAGYAESALHAVGIEVRRAYEIVISGDPNAQPKLEDILCRLLREHGQTLGLRP